MPTTTIRLAVAATICLTAVPALAQPGAAVPAKAPAVTPAPQTNDWSEVSHINGQLVKVGEKNEYLLDFKKTMISTNPVGMMLGFYSFSVSYAVSQNVAIRGDLSIISPPDGDGDSMTQIGVSAPLFMKRTYSGVYLEPGVIHRSWTDGDATDGPEVLLGYQVTYDSGLSFAMAFGAGRDINADHASADDYDYESPVFADGYFRVGYAF